MSIQIFDLAIISSLIQDKISWMGESKRVAYEKATQAMLCLDGWIWGSQGIPG